MSDLTSRFDEALVYARNLHDDQNRKGSAIPYFAHLLSVTALVLEHGGDEDEAIAAVLHDAVEDQGGAETLADIRRRFGDRVADIVDGCSDTDQEPKPPWRKRKETYIDAVKEASSSIRLVSACDKLHNARSILYDYLNLGESLWDRFTGGREGTLWYYRSLIEAYRTNGNNSLVDELERVIAEVERLTKENAG